MTAKQMWRWGVVFGVLAVVCLMTAGVMAQETPADQGTAPAADTAASAQSSAPTGQAAAKDINSQKGEGGSSQRPAGTSSGLAGVMAVTLIIWIGLFASVYRLDRKVRRLEVS
jgi:CcmD family protein